MLCSRTHVGSSSAIRLIAATIFSVSAIVTGRIARVHLGWGNLTKLNWLLQSLPFRVLPVCTSLSLTVQPISPAHSFSTGFRSAPELTKSCARRSLLPRSALVSSSPAFTVPLITLKYWTSPICGSIPVLKKKREVGSLSSVVTSLPSELSVLGISLTKGTTLPRNSIIRSTPMF